MNHKDARLMLCPRNYSGQAQVSHTGLAVSASNTARVLRANSINAEVHPMKDRDDLERLIDKFKPTHVIINALWLPTPDLQRLVYSHMDIKFAVLIHSNLAFLQVESNGIKLLHEAVDLELEAIGNFRVAANSRNACRGLEDAWECPTTYLPNLYFLDDTVRTTRPKWNGGTLRIGAFGAMRPLKNPTASAFAALAIASNMGADVELHINVGRNDGGWADRLTRAVENIFLNRPHAKIVKVPWDHWAGFRRQVRHMHLLLQPSFTESFNVVTADGVAEGIPSVVSDVIEWAPDHWKAAPDDVMAIARVGRSLLTDLHTGKDGFDALSAHNLAGVREWTRFLES